MGYSPTTVNGSSGLVGMSANVLDSTSIFNTTPVSTTFHTGPQSYLDYSHEVSAYSYPTSEYAATRDLYAAPAIADHGTTATYGPRPDYMNESSPSIEGFSGFSPHPRSTSATSLTPSHDGQASELPSAQTTIRNLELSPEPLQWNGAYGDGIIPIEEWLAILRAAASGSPDAPDTENEGKQDDLQASTGEYRINIADSRVIMKRLEDFNAAPVQGFTAAASTLLGAEPQPPAGLLWTDAPSAELVEWLDLPSDFDFTFGASSQGTTDDESLRAPRLSGSDEFNPWSGSGASPSSYQGPSSHDLWEHQRDW
ncbi:uncharacterized protein B0H18DRAFT_1016813 [Fomitopsis serialis]|uniref:uncharacterized protein n=1 Tax=Fomitopsis serialis TaxID=139415 RepID=UPI002007C96B|nr:uncharacterized protein B0H18DRAFT_1016813 [Neoantrodia serialis]KAH9922756.1 hypothetical protein B0H18DRAFT_1016813 [Neoantrodia serialis]